MFSSFVVLFHTVLKVAAVCVVVFTDKPLTICMNNFFNMYRTLRKLMLRSRQPLLRFGTTYRNLLSPDFSIPMITQSLIMVTT